MSYYDDVIEANIIPNQRVSDAWRGCVASARLTAFWTRETARYTGETCDEAEIVVKGIKEFIDRPKVKEILSQTMRSEI